MILTRADADAAVGWDAREAATVVTTDLGLAAYEPTEHSSTVSGETDPVT